MTSDPEAAGTATAPGTTTGPGTTAASGRAVAAAVVVLATALHALFSWQQWTALIVPSWDLAIFSQLAKAYSRFEAPVVPIKGIDFNLLGDHFHPILVLLGPVWALWPSGLALLLVQAVLLGVSAWPLTRLAVERYGSRWGTVFGLGYALSWGMQAAVAAQFHEIAFAVPLLAFSLAAFLRERPVAAALWAAPLVFVKEDLGITVALLGVLIAWRFRHPSGHRPSGHRPGDGPPSAHRPAAPVLGIALAAWGLAWVVLAVGVILPALNPGGQYDYTDRLTDVAAVLTPGSKWLTLLMLVTTAGVAGLRSPLFLLVVPTLAWRFAGDVEQYWSWGWHYDAILMPIALAALLDGLRPRSSSRVGNRPDRGRGGGPVDGGADARTGWPARGALAVAVGTTLVLGAALPYATLLRPETWVRTWRWEPAQRVIATIPPGARVETDLTLLAYLVPRAEVSWVGTESRLPDFVVVDDYSAAWGGMPPEDPAAWATDRWGEPFTTVLEDGGFTVARRG